MDDLQPSLMSSISSMNLKVLSLFDILSVVRTFMAFGAQTLLYIVMSFNTPLLSNHIDGSGYSPIFMGVAMMSASIFFVIIMFIVPWLTTKISKKGVLFIGLIIQSVGI